MVIQGNTYDPDGHALKCGTCLYVSPTYQPHTLGAYTKTTTTHSRKCSGCNYTQTSPHDNITAVPKDANNHTQTCGTCGSSQSVAHTITYSNITTTAHTASCAVCGYHETVTHTISTIKDENTHYTKCTKCTYQSPVGNHTFSWSTDNSTYHYYKCTSCGYYTESGKHNENGTTHTNTQHTLICGTCGRVGATNNHVYPTSYTPDGPTQHYRQCTKCTYRLYVNHSFSTVSNDPNGHYRRCSCGYTETIVPHSLPSAYTTTSTTHSKTCSGCSYKESASHSWGYMPNNATHHTAWCGVCGYTIANQSHSFSSGTCTKCMYVK